MYNLLYQYMGFIEGAFFLIKLHISNYDVHYHRRNKMIDISNKTFDQET